MLALELKSRNIGAGRFGAPPSKPKMAQALLPVGEGVEDFIFGRTIGAGSFGRVKVAQYFRANKNNFDSSIPATVAIKILKKSAIIKMKQVDHVTNEKDLLLEVNHPFTVQCYGCFQDDRRLYIVMELAPGGEFFTFLRRSRRLNENSAKFYAAQVCDIFDFLHSKNIIYRDLKPENMLLGSDGYIKLTDFGFAKRVESRTDTLCGTPEYLAPEVLLNKGHGKPVDWWTLGILIYEMIVGYPPFVDEDPIGIYKKILAGNLLFPAFFPKDAKALVKKLLQPDVTQRLGNLKNNINDVKECSWFTSINFDELRAKKNPAPHVPEVGAGSDASNFEVYPESIDNCPALSRDEDPFLLGW